MLPPVGDSSVQAAIGSQRYLPLFLNTQETIVLVAYRSMLQEFCRLTAYSCEYVLL